MTVRASVRAARVELALALMNEPDRMLEADAELRDALGESGDDPPEWAIRRHLGLLAQQLDDRETAAHELLASVMGAPAAEADEVAEEALGLLDGRDARRLATGLDPVQVRSLTARATQPDAPSSVLSLATRILLARGDTEAARSLLSSFRTDVPNDPAIDAAQAVTRALEHIDEGAYSAALAVLDDAGITTVGPAGAGARAIALYGMDRLDDALAAATGVPATFDTAVVQALVWLARAQRGFDADESVDPSDEADRVASVAARMEPTRGDGLLLRAQVMLERGEDIDGGRQLLDKALRRLDNEPDQARLWRVQRAVRHDDRFRYVALEVAATRGRSEELLAVAQDELPLSDTSWEQDAAVAERIAEAHRDAGHPARAAGFYMTAAGFHAKARDSARALEARQLANELNPSTEGLLALAQDLWQASYAQEPQGPDAANRALDDGLQALDQLDAGPLDPEPAERAESGYLRGLLLARRAEAPGSALTEVWRPLPWLLLSAMEDPSHSYRAAYAAWALDTAGLGRPALHFAERAIDLDEYGDTWLHEALIVMYLNWHGVLDDRVQRLLDESEYADWVATIRMVDALHRNDLTAAGAQIPHATLNAAWAREIRASTIAQVHGLGAAEKMFHALRDEFDGGLVDHQSAADVAVILRDLHGARRSLQMGESAGTVAGPRAAFTGALIDLADGHDGALEALCGQVRAGVRPYLVREWGRRFLPVVALAWSDDRVTPALDMVRSAADERLEELVRMPPLSAEIDTGGVTSTDPALDELVRALLSAEEEGGDAGAEGLRRLAADPALPRGLAELLMATAAPR